MSIISCVSTLKCRYASFIAKWLTPVHYRAAKASKFLLPLITKRYELLKESENDWNALPVRPNRDESAALLI